MTARHPIFQLLLLIGASTNFLGQGATTSPASDNAVPIGLTPAFVAMKGVDINAISTQASALDSSMTLVFPDGVTSTRNAFAEGISAAGAQNTDNASFSNRRNELSSPGGNIDGLDTVPTFDGAFLAQAGPSKGRLFRFTMIGNHPAAGGTTEIPGKITEVSLDLLNSDGTLNFTVPFGPYSDLIEDSPNFDGRANYASGRHLQFADAVQRAEFWNRMEENWHTVLQHNVVDQVTMRIPRFVNVIFPDGTIRQVQAYYVRTAPNGSQYYLVLDILFQQLLFNQAVGDIIAGNFTTDALNMSLFPNTFLFSINNQGQIADCCVLGFHTYIYDTVTLPQPRWIFQYASWISPGIFGGGFQDVTALSHETSEAFNDPFVDNATPVWKFPPPANAFCQNNLETGDPVEVLPNATVPIRIREGHNSFTYHPQTEALLQWFEMGSSSNAIDGAFSFPDESALPHSALPCTP